MSEKKVKHNECYISGEAINITERVLNEGTALEALTYDLTIDTGNGQNILVTKYAQRWDGTEESAAYKGADTILAELKTRVDNGQGDKVNCTCKIDGNNYYSEGKLIEGYRINVSYCNREKDSKYPIKPGQLWIVDVLVDAIEDVEEDNGNYTLIKGLILKSDKKGNYMSFRIYDEDMRQGFKEMYAVGSVGKLEGEFREIIIEKEPERRGFGSRVKPKKSYERYLEVTGGEEPINTTYDEKTKTLTVTEITDANNPFNVDNVERIRDEIETKLDQLKEKDAQKMMNTQTVSVFVFSSYEKNKIKGRLIWKI